MFRCRQVRAGDRRVCEGAWSGPWDPYLSVHAGAGEVGRRRRGKEEEVKERSKRPIEQQFFFEKQKTKRG